MRDSLSRHAAMGLACLFVFSVFGVLSALSAGHARAEGAATPMAAASGMLKKTGHAGPWGYGCAFPDGASQAKGMTCTLGRILAGEAMAGKNEAGKRGTGKNGVVENRPDGMLMFLHATPDFTRQPLASQPWALAFLLPPTEAADRAVPARLVVDHGAGLSIPWQGCTSQGCSAQLATLPDTVMASLHDGRQAQVVAQRPDGGRWAFTIPLDSLQAAMRKVDFWVMHDELKP